MKTESKEDRRDAAGISHASRPSESHLHQAFDVGRLDNEVEPPKLLLDVVHIGVAIWGVLLAAGVYLFGGQDWRESVLVLAVFAFFLGAWRLAMYFGARKKRAKERSEKKAAEAKRDAVRRLAQPTERAQETEAPVDPDSETREASSSLESTVAASEYARR